jgi:hypothetical protein
MRRGTSSAGALRLRALRTHLALSRRSPERCIRSSPAVATGGARIGPIAGWGPDHRPLVDGELLLQGQVLEGELAVAAEEEGEYPKQVE